MRYPQNIFIHLAVAVFIMKHRDTIVPMGNIVDSPCDGLTVHVDRRRVYRLFA